MNRLRFALAAACASAGCAPAAPYLPNLLHETRVGLSQADMASALVAFGEYCEDRPFTVFRTTGLHIQATVTAAGPLLPGEVRPADSIQPVGGHAVARAITVDLQQERVDPSELRKTLAHYTELCKHLSVGDDRFTLKPGGIQAQGPAGRWYAAENVLARKMTEIFWEVLWRHPAGTPGADEQLPPIPPHIDPIDMPTKVPRVEPVD